MVKFLVPGLCLGTHCFGGSASLRNACETRILDDSAGRACKSVGSKAEPWNQSVAIGEKCPNYLRFFEFMGGVAWRTPGALGVVETGTTLVGSSRLRTARTTSVTSMPGLKYRTSLWIPKLTD